MYGRKPPRLYLLLVFSDMNQRNLIYIGKFKKIKDILSYTKNKLKYSDVPHKSVRIYNTYKNFFRILKISQEDKKYFT